MSKFVCHLCGHVDNTATSRYWFRGDGAPLCSLCDPTIGRWHDIFPRRPYDPERDSGARHRERWDAAIARGEELAERFGWP